MTEKEMENDVREHLNLAHYNFNRMAVIDEEGIENQGNSNNLGSRQNGNESSSYLASAGGPELKQLKNMHNTTSGFYPQRFGDRVPTRGDVQSKRGNRINLIPSAQGGRRGNSRADNSLNRV